MSPRLWCRDLTVIANPGTTGGVYRSTDWDSADTADVMGWFAHQQAVENDDGTRDPTVTQPVAWFPVGTAVTALDRVRVNDVDPPVTYEVDGVPNVAYTPRGPHHVECRLTRVSG